MAKVRNENKGFEAIPRALINDNSLSDRARFLYCYMSAKPDDWDFYLDYLAKELHLGRDTVQKYMRELINAGWIEKLGQQNDGGKFGAVEYVLKSFKCTGTVGEKSRYGKIPLQNINSSIDTPINENISNINIPDKETYKKLSDDNSLEGKTDTLDELFEQFWNLYGKKKGKAETRKVWDRLSKADRQKAIDAIEPYKRSVRYDTRFMRDPIRYLRHKTWLDDFDTMNRKTFYDIQEGDCERVVSYKQWMRKTYPNIEEARKPLTYDEYLRLFNEYSRDELREQLEYLNENIVRYRNSCIAEEIAYYLKKKREAAA